MKNKFTESCKIIFIDGMVKIGSLLLLIHTILSFLLDCYEYISVSGKDNNFTIEDTWTYLVFSKFTYNLAMCLLGGIVCGFVILLKQKQSQNRQL